MSPRNFAIQTIIYPLVTNGFIDGEREKALFEEALRRQEEIKQVLLPLGATLLVDVSKKIIVMTAISSVTLDRLTDEQNAHPILSAVQKPTRSYRESVALLTFKRSLNQEATQGGEEIWLTFEQIDYAIRQAYAKGYERDEHGQATRTKTILTRLKNDGLIMERMVHKEEQYRGTKFLSVVISLDDIREFEALQNEVLREETNLFTL